MRELTLILFCGIIALAGAEESGYFTVIGSKLLRPNRPYRVSIHHEGYTGDDKTLEISVKGQRFNETKQVVLRSSDSSDKELVFNTPRNIRGDYELRVKSLSGEKFESSRTVKASRKQYSVFIQTDKSIYKPADKVQFRVLVLDTDTRPYRPSKVEVYITDGESNRVKQFTKPQLIAGLFESELKLSDLPVMGKWKVNVKINSQKEFSKEFEVAEYTLPKFEFILDANPDANYKDGKIMATARAKYTFGKIAKGNATITAEKKHLWWGDHSRKVTKTVAVDGKKFVEFDIEKELGITASNREHTIDLSATFTEELSGKEQNATAKVQIHITPHKIEMQKSGEKFKPGLNYKVTAVVRLHDKNAPVTDAHNALKFTTKHYYDVDATCTRYFYRDNYRFGGGFGRSGSGPSEEYECREEKSYETVKEIFVKNGIANLELEVPQNTTKIDVEAKYFDTVESVKGIQKAATECNEYIQAKLLTESPSLNKKVIIEVQATSELRQLTYQVIGGGSVIQSETATTPRAKHFELSFQPKAAMAPKSQVIIYYIASNGEMISDKVELEFANELKNQIDLQLSTQQAKPGSDLEISIKTQPNSFVGLLGVDQSVLVLKKGNDIDQSEVLKELETYNQLSDDDEYVKKDYKDFKSAIIITNMKSEYELKQKPLKGHGRNGGWSSPSFDFDSPEEASLSLLSLPSNLAAMRGRFGGSSANAAASSQSFGFNRAFAMPQMSLSARDRYEDDVYETRSHSIPVEKPKKSKKQPIEVRTVFPETWMFDSLQIGANETSVRKLVKKVPDTITSWIITGFSLNPTSGLGLTREAAKLNVFQPFFVSTNLPYSIKRGEVASIPIVVFNYMQDDQDVEVTFFNKDQEFEFVEPNEQDNQINRHRHKRALELQRVKTVHVKSNEGASVKFMIRPRKVGHMTIKVNAESDIAGDGVEQQLLVIPEGVTQYGNEAILVDLRNGSEFSSSIDIVVPTDAVADSTKIEAAVTGDILGPSIENLDKLIKLPYGCGEQNMLNFVPNIVVLDYLTSVGKLTQEVEDKAIGFLESGYQRQLGYKHPDGSYSAFGKSDGSGSTWLTAFVAKSFHQAAKYIAIDQEIVKQALNFLERVQKRDGSFPEVGRMLSKSMQGGASKGIALTAYTLITFLENDKHAESFSGVIEKAIEYILANMEDITDNYSLAIASYALQLAQNSQRDTFLGRINGKSMNDNGMKYWTRDDAGKSDSSKPNSINIEMTAYGLQAFLAAERDVDALAIGKWLITQRNENGGFQSTQDTVVGLQALAKLAAKIYTSESDVQISLTSDAATTANINVNGENALVLQKYELPAAARHFDIAARGNGLSMLQVSYRYNVDDSLKQPRFTLVSSVESDSNADYLHLTVCTSFVPDATADTSNMAVMELNLPSGFTYDTDHVAELKAGQRVKKVELKDGDTVVIIYLDSVDSNVICPEFKSYRTHGVAKQKPSPIVIYDYYDNSRLARTFYNPPAVSLCDICGDEDECSDACEVDGIAVD